MNMKYSTAVHGHLDRADRSKVIGWAYDPHEPRKAVELEIFVNDAIVETVVADRFRQDLLDRGVGNGHHAFEFCLPFACSYMASVTIGVRIKATTLELNGSPVSIGMQDKRAGLAQMSRAAHQYLLENVCSHVGSLPIGGEHGKDRRVALFAMHEDGQKLTPNARSLLQGLRATCRGVVVINSAPNRQLASELESYADVLITRNDHGRDLASWYVAWLLESTALRAFYEIIMVNDSVFGPFFPLEPLFEKALAHGYDCWGITDHWAPYHIQSYFRVFGKPVIDSGLIDLFYSTFQPSNDKWEGIHRDEQGFCTLLLNHGFTLGALCPYDLVCQRFLELYPDCLRRLSAYPETRSGVYHPESYTSQHEGYVRLYQEFLLHTAESVRLGRPINVTAFFWDILIQDFGSPFLKREVLYRNPSKCPTAHWLTVLESCTQFDPRIILDTMKMQVHDLAPTFDAAYPDQLNAGNTGMGRTAGGELHGR